jgi:hypothetical protein
MSRFITVSLIEKRLIHLYDIFSRCDTPKDFKASKEFWMGAAYVVGFLMSDDNA